MRILNSLIVPKNLKEGTLGLFNIHSVKIEGGLSGHWKIFEKKVSQSRKGGSLIVSKKVERGTLMLRNACKK